MPVVIALQDTVIGDMWRTAAQHRNGTGLKFGVGHNETMFLVRNTTRPKITPEQQPQKPYCAMPAGAQPESWLADFLLMMKPGAKNVVCGSVMISINFGIVRPWINLN